MPFIFTLRLIITFIFVFILKMIMMSENQAKISEKQGIFLDFQT